MTSASESVSFLRFSDVRTGIIINHTQIHGMSAVAKETKIKSPFPHIKTLMGEAGKRRLVFNLEDYLHQYFGFTTPGTRRICAQIKFPENSPLLEKVFSTIKIKKDVVDDLSCIEIRIDRDFEIISLPLSDISAPATSVRRNLAKAGLLGFYPEEKILYYFIDLYIIIANEIMRRSNEHNAGR